MDHTVDLEIRTSVGQRRHCDQTAADVKALVLLFAENLALLQGGWRISGPGPPSKFCSAIHGRSRLLSTSPPDHGSSLTRLVRPTDFHPPQLAGSHGISVLRCTDSHAARGAAITSLFDRCSLTVSTCPPRPIEKFRHAPRTDDTSALLSSPLTGRPRWGAIEAACGLGQ